MTVEQMQQEKVLTIGENIKIRRFAMYAEGTSVAYVHMGGKIGVLLNMTLSDNIKGNEQALAMGRDIAMQIAAMRPSYLKADEVDAETLEKEKEILMAQALNEGKPQQVAEKIVPLLHRGCSWNCLPRLEHLHADARNCGWTSNDSLVRLPD